MNILSNLQQIANIIIRPSRYTYKMTDLGNKTFKIGERTVFREDFELKNPRGLKIKASIYSAQQLKQTEQVMVYLHCNSGCRIEGLAYLKLAIENDFAYVVFDFTGSGMSEGKYVSLGFYETIDLQCVYQHLKSITSEKAKFVLWGRSMGAVTALNFLLKNKQQVFMAVFDSPFRSLKQLFIQIGRQKTSFPDFILEMAYNYLKPIILQKAIFDIQKVDLKFQTNSISIPGIFIASKQDSLVPFQQIDEIFSFYKGQKEMHFIEQGHNQARNFKVIGEVFRAIKRQFMSSEANERLKFEKEVEKKNYFSGFGGQRLDKKELSRKKLELTIKSLSQRQLLTTTIGKVMREQQLLQERKNSKINIKDTIKLRQNNIHFKIQPSTSTSSQPTTHHHPQQPIPSPPITTNPSSSQQPPISTPTLQKKPISCLLLPHKKSLKILSIDQEQQENRFSFQQQSERKLMMNNNNNKSESKLKVKRKPLEVRNFFGEENREIRQRQKDSGKEKELFVRIEDGRQDEGKVRIEPLREKPFNHMTNHPTPNPTTNSQLTPTDPQKPLQSPSTPSICIPFPNNPTLPQNQRRLKLHLNNQQSSNKKSKQLNREQPHSDIKNENLKVDCHEDFVHKEKEFLKRCESLERVFKGDKERNDKKERNDGMEGMEDGYEQLQHLHPQTTHTYREIKCTQRVLQKIIEKQQRKLLILNLQSTASYGALQPHNTSNKRKPNPITNKQNKPRVGGIYDKQKQKKESHGHQESDRQIARESTRETTREHQKQRKTLQHVINNNKQPFVELKGVNRLRNSFENKYKSEIRK